jgi:hypothetical protein
MKQRKYKDTKQNTKKKAQKDFKLRTYHKREMVKSNFKNIKK